MPALVGRRAALACIIILALQGCATNNPAAHDADMTWDCEKMHAVQAEWQALRDLPSKQIPGDDGKTKYGIRQRMFDQLFRKHLSLAESRALAASCDALPPRLDDSFACSALAFVVKRLAEAGERRRLVSLLAKRCPTWIDGAQTIEFYLAAHDDLLADAAVILGDAYLRCEVRETRAILALALRRGFDGFGIGGRDDAEFIANAMTWYFTHKSNISFNGAYGGNIISPTRAPLFVGKPDPESIPRATDHFWERPQHYDAFEKSRSVTVVPPSLEGTWEVIEAEDKSAHSPEWSANGSKLVFRDGLLECFTADGEKKEQFRVQGARGPVLELREMPRSAQIKVNDWYRTEELSPRPAFPATYNLAGGILRIDVFPGVPRPSSAPFHDQEASYGALLTLRRVRETAGTPRTTTVDQGASISWGGPTLRGLRAEWKKLQDACYDAPQSVPGKTEMDKLRYTQRKTWQLFRKNLSQPEVLKLAGSCETVPLPLEDTGFEEALLAFIVKALAELNERERLVEMLSKRCPTWIPWPQPIEHYLVTEGRRLDDPFLVLCDAYSRCHANQTRQTLAEAVHRALAGENNAVQDDARYVDDAMRWYEIRKDELRVNGAYLADGTGSPKTSLFNDEPISPSLYGPPLTRRFNRFLQPLTSTAQMLVVIGTVCLVWILHVVIAAALSAPIIIRSRNRARCRRRDIAAALVVPFAVWLLLLFSHVGWRPKGLGNLAEPILFALAIPIAALLRVRLFQGAFWQAHRNLLAVALLALLSTCAATVYFVAPAWVP